MDRFSPRLPLDASECESCNGREEGRGSPEAHPAASGSGHGAEGDVLLPHVDGSLLVRLAILSRMDEYHVAGRSFHGQTQPSMPNPPLEQLTIGQPVVVFYDPEKPEDSVLGDPKPILQNETISVLLGATIIPIFLIAILLGKTSRTKAIQAQAA